MTLVRLARLGRPVGLEGEISLHLLTDRPEQVLSRAGEYRLENGRAVRVKQLLKKGDRWRWLLEPDDPARAREYAGRFTNGIVVAEADALPFRGDASFSEYELTGMEVRDAGGCLRGEIVRIEERHGFDAWIVREPDGKESELPAISHFVIEIDRARRSVIIHAEGLIR